MNSATWTLSSCDFDCVLLWKRASIDSGEFMVMVAAVETASHEGRPSCLSVASFSIFLKTDWIFGGAGTGPGRECAAFMSCLRAGDSLDMMGELGAAVCDCVLCDWVRNNSIRGFHGFRCPAIYV